MESWLSKKEEAEIVRWIFDEYLGGKGSYTIVEELETAGIPTIRGAKEWLDSVVKGILQNCAYEGDLLLQKTYTTDGVPFIRKNNRGELPQYLIADDHEPIITREEAARQSARFMSTGENGSVWKIPVCIRTGMHSAAGFSAGSVGQNFAGRKSTSESHMKKSSGVATSILKDSKKCSQKAVREDVIQAAFLTLWNRLASNYEEILIPMLAGAEGNPGQPGAGSGNAGDRTEYPGTKTAGL